MQRLRATRFAACLCAVIWMAGCATQRGVVVQTRTIEVPVAQFVRVPERYTVAALAPEAPAPLCTDSGAPVLCASQLVDWIEDGWAPALELVNARLAAIACLSRALTEEQKQSCVPPGLQER